MKTYLDYVKETFCYLLVAVGFLFGALGLILLMIGVLSFAFDGFMIVNVYIVLAMIAVGIPVFALGKYGLDKEN